MPGPGCEAVGQDEFLHSPVGPGNFLRELHIVLASEISHRYSIIRCFSIYFSIIIIATASRLPLQILVKAELRIYGLDRRREPNLRIPAAMQGPKRQSQRISRWELPKKQPTLRSARQREVVQCIKEQQPFRFFGLPLEIRTMIYLLCLVSSSATTVKIYFTYGGICILGILKENCVKWDDLVGLMSDFSSRDSTKPEHRWLNANLIRVNRELYQEAASILYIRNTFKFEGEDGLTMDAFSLFQYRMTSAIRDNLQVFHLQTPSFKRFTYGGFRRGPHGDLYGYPYVHGSLLRVPDEKLFTCLKNFHHLETLHLHIYEDVMLCDLDVLRKINTICGSCKIILHAEKPKMVICDAFCDRLVRIHGDAIAMIHQWGWQLEGKVEQVDEGPSSLGSGRPLV